jgi:signal transduction histidine kinase
MDAMNIQTAFPNLSTAAHLPPVQWHEADHRGHVVQFYSDDSYLLDGLSRFIGTALGAGDSAIVIATQKHLDGLALRLKLRGFDLAKAARHGRYNAFEALEALSSFMLDSSPDPQRFRDLIVPALERASAAAEGENRRVVAFGEMVALLWAEGQVDAAIRLEQLWNDVARTHKFSLRCAYPIKAFDQQQHGTPFLKICSEHSAVIPGESYTALANDDQRLRTVAQLQQQAEAFETEKLLHEALQSAYTALEQEIAERRRAQEKLRASELSLRDLSRRLLETQDEERRHLGRELHDTLGQHLVVLKMGLDLLKSERRPTGDAAVQLLADCAGLVEQSIKEIRTMSYLLYPPMLEEAGLGTAAVWYVDGFTKRSGIETTLDMPPDFDRVPREVELAIFRVLQESLTNVHRHSGSQVAHVRLCVSDGSIHLEIKDEGKGIPAAVLQSFNGQGTVGVGLRGMQERLRHLGGSLALDSNQDGTTLHAAIPLHPYDSPQF